MCHSDVKNILVVEAYSLTVKHVTRITWHSPLFDGILAFLFGAQRITRTHCPRRRPISPFAVGRLGCRREIATTQMHSSDERRREDTECGREEGRERAATAALQVSEPESERAPDRACTRRTKASAADGGAVLGFEVN